MLDPIGPLPPEVYWRRRAIALGAVLLGAALLGWAAFLLAGALREPSRPAAPPPQAAPAPPAAPPQCTDQELRLIAEPVRPSTPEGEPVALRTVLTNTGARACIRDLDRRWREVVVSTSDGERFWSSADCRTESTNEQPLLEPGASVRHELEWPAVSSAPGGDPDRCAAGSRTAPPGDYVVGARVGGLVSAPTPFRIG